MSKSTQTNKYLNFFNIIFELPDNVLKSPLLSSIFGGASGIIFLNFLAPNSLAFSAVTGFFGAELGYIIHHYYENYGKGIGHELEFQVINDDPTSAIDLLLFDNLLENQDEENLVEKKYLKNDYIKHAFDLAPLGQINDISSKDIEIISYLKKLVYKKLLYAIVKSDTKTCKFILANLKNVHLLKSIEDDYNSKLDFKLIYEKLQDDNMYVVINLRKYYEQHASKRRGETSFQEHIETTQKLITLLGEKVISGTDFHKELLNMTKSIDIELYLKPFSRTPLSIELIQTFTKFANTSDKRNFILNLEKWKLVYFQNFPDDFRNIYGADEYDMFFKLNILSIQNEIMQNFFSITKICKDLNNSNTVFQDSNNHNLQNPKILNEEGILNKIFRDLKLIDIADPYVSKWQIDFNKIDVEGKYFYPDALEDFMHTDFMKIDW